MSLLNHRKRHLATELEWLIQDTERLRRAVESGIDDPHGMSNMTAGIAMHANLAATYARLVEDLSDVERYGAGGGRSSLAPGPAAGNASKGDDT